MTNNTETKQLDLLWGAEEIAQAIGRSRRSTFDMLDKGQLPAKKVNGRWVIERSKLVEFFTEAA
ncbi:MULTISPECIES: helix-turn-helix domain-containing protein [unclassified Rhizobium]|uniref:helix-turn-helix domain-containing protein n=1 Tax=unclassified Rhizobium TaxID=2613769 RepID=UPI0028890445|nr:MULTISPECIES: helix-turn-helix domain-containing protein [unclassified Rhizobium]